MTTDYEILLRVRVPRATVFEKLLRIEHLARWFCGWSRIEPKVGGKFQFGGETCLVLPEGRGWETTIDEGETLRRFAFTWPIRGAATRVSYELEDQGPEATLLTARHRGVPMKESTCGTIQDAWRMCLGNLKSIAEGRSDSVRPDHAPVVSRELRLSNLIEAPPERLFDALTDPAQVDHWSTGGVPNGKVRVEPRVGGAFFLDWDDGPDQILEFEPPARLGLRWPREAGDLRVTFSLEPKSSGTAIYLTGTGYGESEQTQILHHRGRWSDLLVCLKNFVEAGDAGFANAYGRQVRER
jgi:uncharacterized protein YndB with AHSA1/START domain